MTDNNLGENLLTIYVQLTPWVQAFLAVTACVIVIGVAWLFKETVAVLTGPFVRPRPVREMRAVPGVWTREWPPEDWLPEDRPPERPERIPRGRPDQIHDD